MRVGDYELGQQLGEGGMATVYKARHVVLDTHHAVKVLNAKFRESADVRTRFLDEAKLQAKYLDHPNIVKVTNIVSTPEAAALVMELIEGTSLDKEIGRLKTDPVDAKRIMLGILNGVGHAHSKGVIHRDIKPANVLLARRGQKLFPKVTDFGIAKVNNPDANPSKKKTHVDARMGTLAYMSPEQLRRARDVTPRSDVFSLGVMLYEMVTGVLPFEGENDYDVMESIVNARFTPPATRNPKLDPVMASVIETAIKADPAERFASCEDMAAVLSGEKQLGAVLAAAPKPVVPTAKLTNPAEAPAKSSTPPQTAPGHGAVASTPLTTPPATQTSGGSSRLIGFGLLALALAIGALALVFALKKDPSNTADAEGIPSDATRQPNGIAYKFIVPPTPGERTPSVHDAIAIDQIEVDKDGNPTGATPPPNIVTWANTSFFPLTSVIGSMTVGSILRVWYPPSFGKRIVEYRFKRYVLDSSDPNQPIPPPPPTGSTPLLRPIQRNQIAPSPAPSEPIPLPPSASIRPGHGYCIVGSLRKSECASNPGNFPNWHFHSYVSRNGQCLACYDEENATCDELGGLGIYRISDSDCGSYPASNADGTIAGN